MAVKAFKINFTIKKFYILIANFYDGIFVAKFAVRTNESKSSANAAEGAGLQKIMASSLNAWGKCDGFSFLKSPGKSKKTGRDAYLTKYLDGFIE